MIHKKHLPLIRLDGEINVSFNGETKTSISYNGSWLNFMNMAFSGDMGCLYPKRPADGNGCALESLCQVFEDISAVPYENDSSYEKYATEELNELITNKVPEIIRNEFLKDYSVKSVKVICNDPEEKIPVFTVTAKLQSTEYVNFNTKIMKDAELLGDVIDSSMEDNGDFKITYRNGENEGTYEGSISESKIAFIGIDDFSNAEKIYKCNEGYHALTNKHYVIPETEPQDIVIEI